MTRWVRDLRRAQAENGRVALVTVVSTHGSAPRDANARMIVTPHQAAGTIGGGHLELRAIEIARELLATGGKPLRQRFSLGASLGQCCGGKVELLFQPVERSDTWVGELTKHLDAGVSCSLVTMLDFTRLGQTRVAIETGTTGGEQLTEVINPCAFQVYLFGAGHVARALVRILGELDCAVTWIDARPSEFPANVPDNVIQRVTDDPADEVACAQAGSNFVVMTHDHALDQAICEAVLRRADFAYFGLIGSMTKRRLFEQRLMARGVDATSLARMICPVGDLSLRSKTPMVIAMGLAAQLQRHYEACAPVRLQPLAPASKAKTQALARLPGHIGPESRANA